jgi:aryl-alcohol dehydrogenase-like predicted oxidoreductase
MLTRESRWPEGDFRNIYFAGDKLQDSVTRAEVLRALLPPGITMAEFALRWILSNPSVTVVIPGMRKPAHVAANLAASDAGPLSSELLDASRQHRWDRRPSLQPD